jgi:hypothetical protein
MDALFLFPLLDKGLLEFPTNGLSPATPGIHRPAI